MSTRVRRVNASPKEAPTWSILVLREPRYSQSLERGLAILGCFTPKRPVPGLRAHTHPYLEELDVLGPHLVSTANRISARLGYRRDDEISREV
jgi:hypothetical protein